MFVYAEKYSKNYEDQQLTIHQHITTMKISIISILMLALPFAGFSQDTLTFYYKANGKETAKIAKAYYSKQIIYGKDKTLMKEVLLEKKRTIEESELKSWNPYIENGLTKYYDSSSDLLLAKGYYKNAMLDSIWIYKNIDNSYDTVSYTGIDPSKKYPLNKETFVIVENMPLIGLYLDLKERRESLDKVMIEFLKNKKNNPNRDRYMELQNQVLEVNRIAFDRFKKENLKYPLRAKKNKKTGIVYAKMVIDENGKTNEIEIAEGIDKDLDTETIRLLKTLPISSAGRQNGKSVRVIMTVGVKFE